MRIPWIPFGVAAVVLGLIWGLWPSTEAPPLAVHEGEPAPDFGLVDQAGKSWALGSYRDKWLVLYFYSKDDSPSATKLAVGFRDKLPDLGSMGAVIVGVGADAVESHRRFAHKLNLNFSLLSDSSLRLCSRYGLIMDVMWKRLCGTATVIIDPEGTVQKVFSSVEPEGHAEEVRAALAGLQESYLLLADRIASANITGSPLPPLDELAKQGIPFNIPTFIHHAERGPTQIVELFLAAGMSPDARDGHDTTALIYAASAGQTDTVKMLLSNGARVDPYDGSRRTALIAAFSSGQMEIARLLLDHGAGTNISGDDAFTPLILPAVRGETPWSPLETLERLKVRYNASEFVRRAGYSSLSDDLVVQLFLQAGMNPNAQNNDGTTALESAAEHDRANVVRMLIAKGVDINKKGRFGRPILIQAAASGSPKTVEILLDHGADINQRDPDGRTALMAAAGNKGGVEVLLARRADPNLRDNDGNTALTFAVYKCNKRSVAALIQNNADVNARNNLGQSVMDTAIKKRCLVDLLTVAGAIK
ncbi:MAG: ankyrin repeat domain-containing protein [Nitrospirae bacterium]|nr:ankyrin repeat domain-containing protein [Nitrospirota bacterium]